MALSEKQKAAREGALGSSDASVVAGVSPYKGPTELFYQLTGQLPRYTDEETRAQKIGSLIEAPIAELTAQELNLKIRRSPPRIHPKFPFMSANLDYEIVANAKGPGALEIKNRGAAKPYDELPDDITLQVAHQLAVTNREWAIVAVLFGFGQLKTYEVQRDRELEHYLIEIEAKFIARVQRNEPPTEDWTPQTIDLLKKLYPQDSGKVIELPPQEVDHVQYYLMSKESIEEFEAQKARHEGAIKALMQDASLATYRGYSISWKSTKPGKKFDEDTFKKENPELYTKYEVTRPGYRRFLIKPSKEVACLPKSPSAKISPPVPDSPPTDPPPPSV